MDIIYQIQFHSFWHSGSGLSGGVIADADVLKTEEGLPYIAGKTLKGLMRDAAFILMQTGTNLVTKDFVDTIFGIGGSSKGTPCHFTNAYLSENISNKIEEKKKMLYQHIASTAINDKGQAVKHSLREIEVTIPIVLYAQIIEFPNDENFVKQLEMSMQYIKRMGTKRHRGLGRCDWSIAKR